MFGASQDAIDYLSDGGGLIGLAGFFRMLANLPRLWDKTQVKPFGDFNVKLRPALLSSSAARGSVRFWAGAKTRVWK